MSAIGKYEVARGALLCDSNEDGRQALGRFMADVIDKIMHGKAASTLNQYFEAPMEMSLNLMVAREINWHPPFEIMEAVDNVYNSVSLTPSSNNSCEAQDQAQKP